MVSNGFQFDEASAAFVAGASVPLSDRGFRYGMLVFETFALKCGRLILADAHARLLDRGAAACGIGAPPAMWLDAAHHLGAGLPDGVLRIYLTAGDGSPAAATNGAPRMFAAFEAMEIYSGPRVRTATATRVAAVGSTLPWVKTGNYWPWIQAAQSAPGAAAVLVAPDGEIRSGAMANVFVRIDGVWVTPPAGAGVRPGAVREWILARVGSGERRIFVSDLHRVDAFILTNSRLPVLALDAMDGIVFSNRDAVHAVWKSVREELLNEAG